MDYRKAIPWVLSLGFHAAVLVVPIGFLMAPAAQNPGVIGVDINLAGTPGAGGRGGRARTSSVGDALVASDSTETAEGADFVRVPRAGTRTGNVASLPKVSTELPTSVLPMEGGSPVEPGAALFLPSARDVLADVTALSGSHKTGSGGTGAHTGGSAATGSGAGAGGSTVTGDGGGTGGGAAAATGTRIGWEGAARKLIRKRDPRFPDVLAAMGQEVDGEARITVAPSGAVLRVEMTRSTGYSEIDAVIEAALRDYLFSRVDGTADAVGTVRFRFRLERRD